MKAAPASLQLSLQLSLQFADASHRSVLTRHRVRRWLTAALERPAELTVRIVSAEEGRALNRDYRGKDYATNVLSFPAELPEGVTLPLLGDLVICAPVVAKEAAEQGKALAAHYAHLTIHGVLHLLGLDHENDIEALVMEAIEREILADMGYSDPYLE